MAPIIPRLLGLIAITAGCAGAPTSLTTNERDALIGADAIVQSAEIVCIDESEALHCIWLRPNSEGAV